MFLLDYLDLPIICYVILVVICLFGFVYIILLLQDAVIFLPPNILQFYIRITEFNLKNLNIFFI